MKKRKPFQVSLRTLLLILLLFGPLSSWARWKIQQLRAQHGAAAPLTNLGASVESEPGLPTWLQRLLPKKSARFFDRVVAVDLFGATVHDADLRHLRKLPHLRTMIAHVGPPSGT